MKNIIYLIVIFNSINLFGQTNYTGFIEKYPIELLANAENSYSAYVCKAFVKPINIVGKLENEKLIFFKKDAKENKSASLTFNNFLLENNVIQGI